MIQKHYRWLGFACRMAAIAVWAALMRWEWNRWPDGSPLLGPLGFAWYGGLDFPTFLFCAISACALLAYLLKPHLITGFISVLGILNWLFWGMIAEGIGC